MNQKKIFIPSEGIESWKKLLADPDKHWKDGYSAKSVAECWETAMDIPKSIRKALAKADPFKKLDLLAAFPEYKVPLPGGSRPSQNDILLVADNTTSLAVFSVEAKVREDFGPAIHTWLSDASVGKKERLDFLLDTINFPKKEYKDLRYQLFHRLASAVIIAKKFHAKQAMMIVQSFEADDALNHYNDYENFLMAYGIAPEKEYPHKIGAKDGIDLYCLWNFSR